MGIQVSTSGATSGNLTQYRTAYEAGIRPVRLYDQFATPVGAYFEPRGATGTMFFLQTLQPRPTTAIGNETSDFDPQTIRDTSATISKEYYADGLKRHEKVLLKSSILTDQALARAVGELAMKTFDALARRKATEGSQIIYGDAGASAQTSRATSDLGTANHHLAFSSLSRATTQLGYFAGDDSRLAVMDGWAYEDLCLSAGNAMITYGTDGGRVNDVLYNYEIGKLAGIRLVVTKDAKAFFAAGANNASRIGGSTTTLNGAANAGAKTITLASATNAAVGMWLAIGTVQTAGESDATLITEAVQITDISATPTLGIVGQGAGGGLLYDHASGAGVSNNDTVHCVTVGSPVSLAVDWDKFGRYGTIVPPFEDGNAKQWNTFSFKGYLGYERMVESALVRIEVSASGM